MLKNTLIEAIGKHKRIVAILLLTLIPPIWWTASTFYSQKIVTLEAHINFLREQRDGLEKENIELKNQIMTLEEKKEAYKELILRNITKLSQGAETPYTPSSDLVPLTPSAKQKYKEKTK